MDDGGRPTLAAGDFNAKHTAWNSRICTPAGNILQFYCQRPNTTTIIATIDPIWIDPTRRQRDEVLDIMVMTKWTGNMSEPIVHNDLPSDHLLVTAELDTNIMYTNTYKQAKNYDWTKFRTLLADIHSTPVILHTTEQIDTQVSKLSKDITNSLTLIIF